MALRLPRHQNSTSYKVLKRFQIGRPIKVSQHTEFDVARVWRAVIERLSRAWDSL